MYCILRTEKIFYSMTVHRLSQAVLSYSTGFSCHASCHLAKPNLALAATGLS